MIVRDVEVYSPRRECHVYVEAIIDTDASMCVIPWHISEELGIPTETERSHLWQVRDPLVLFRSALQIHYLEKSYEVQTSVVEIPEEYRRSIQRGEECTRPSSPHPLTQRIIIGENFLNRLSVEERQQILLSSNDLVAGPIPNREGEL